MKVISEFCAAPVTGASSGAPVSISKRTLASDSRALSIIEDLLLRIFVFGDLLAEFEAYGLAAFPPRLHDV